MFSGVRLVTSHYSTDIQMELAPPS
nr:unnamed protein product [Callosobruchus chinensis]